MGIQTAHSGLYLCAPDSPVRIENCHEEIAPTNIQSSTRIGVEYAGACALRPWRFFFRKNPFVSKPRI